MARTRTLAAAAIAAAVPLLSFTGAVNASAATTPAPHVMQPDSFNCGFGTSGFNVDTCIRDEGGYIVVTAQTVSYPQTIQLCLTWPDGSHVCTDPENLTSPGQIEEREVAIQGQPAGTYCANAWLWVLGGDTNVGHYCMYIP